MLQLEKQRLGKFSLVSAFFSLQYSFQSAETVSGLLKAISNHLVSGGFFLGTIPDGSKIYEELKQDRHCNSFKIEWGQTPIESGFGTNGLGLRYLFSLHSSFNQIPEHALPFSIFSRCVLNESSPPLRFSTIETTHLVSSRTSTNCTALRNKSASRF